MNRSRAIAVAQTVGILILMSLGTVLTKDSLGSMSPLTFVSLVIFTGMVALSFYTFVVRRERIPSNMSSRVWRYIIVIGVCNFTIGRICTTLALDRMPATTQTFLGNFVGFATMGLSIYLLKESPTLFQILGAGIAIFGLWVFFDEIPPASELLGIVLIVGNILAISYTNNAARKLAIFTNNEISNNIISTLALIIGGSLTVLFGLVSEWPPEVRGIRNWTSILYNGTLVIALGMTVWNHVLRTLRSYEASILGASTVIWTTILAAIILGELVTSNQLGGMILLICGLALVQVRFQPRRKVKTVEELA